jgi:Holliday junction resolvasome RuvABC endonuclease subunit
MDKKRDTILAIDPGLREIGYAAIQGSGLVAHGVKSLRLIPRARRRYEARKALTQWLDSYRPAVVVLEATHRHPTGTFQTVHAMARSLATVARHRRRKVVTYSPQTVRKHLVGNGKAEKKAVAYAVAERFPVLRIYLTQDRRWKELFFRNMFDAVALAIHHRDSR